MAECAVFQVQKTELSIKRLMFAGLARVVDLGQNGLARGDARGEVTAAILATGVKLGDLRLTRALWTLVADSSSIDWGIS